jgi:hypothetical protein
MVRVLYKTSQLMIFRKVIVLYWIIIHGAWIHRVGKYRASEPCSGWYVQLLLGFKCLSLLNDERVLRFNADEE